MLYLYLTFTFFSFGLIKFIYDSIYNKADIDADYDDFNNCLLIKSSHSQFNKFYKKNIFLYKFVTITLSILTTLFIIYQLVFIYNINNLFTKFNYTELLILLFLTSIPFQMIFYHILIKPIKSIKIKKPKEQLIKGTIEFTELNSNNLEFNLLDYKFLFKNSNGIYSYINNEYNNPNKCIFLVSNNEFKNLNFNNILLKEEFQVLHINNKNKVKINNEVKDINSEKLALDVEEIKKFILKDPIKSKSKHREIESPILI